MRLFRSLPLVAAIAVTASFLPLDAQQQGDALFVNGRIHVLDSTLSIASAMAVRGGRILAVGANEELRGSYGAFPLHDLRGRNVFPGFTDAHGHLHGLGEETGILLLHGLPSKDAAVASVRARAAASPGSAWIRGRGWDQNLWAGHGFPHRRDLDAVAADRPVFLARVDGHAAWVNSAALAIAGITRGSPDPPGGRILRDDDGEASGILLDNAVDIVKTAIPPPTAAQMQETYVAAVQRCLSVGLTGMHDMGLTRENIEALKALIARDAFPFRLVGYIDGPGDAWEAQCKEGRSSTGEAQLVLAGLKLYADGALGSRGALLAEPYSDDAGNRGLRLSEMDSIRARAVQAMKSGLQMCVHAIGDSAIRLVLDAYERAQGEAGRPRLPLRVEHVQVLSQADIPRFAALGVLPSTHCTSDMTWAEARLGPERIRGAYAWRSLLSTGVYIPAGSDTPVERPNPLWGIYAACTRQDRDGRPATEADIAARFQGVPMPASREHFENGWFGAQRMTRSEAIKAFTIWGARAAGLEQSLGSLEKGKYADFIILSDDVGSVPAPALLTTEVLETWVGGRRVFVKQP